MKEISKERTGELMILGETLIYSLFPVIIAHSTKIMPPVFFAGASILTASISLFIFLLIKGGFKGLKNKETMKNSLGVALFIIIIPSILIFIGSSKTSGINTSILLQMELIFTLVIYGLFSIEKITPQKIFAGTIVFIGAALIIYNGKSAINIGDLLIVGGTAFYPIGNFFAKKALKTGTPSEILFIRSFLGGITLLILSIIFEEQNKTISQITEYWPLIVFNGLFIYHLSKIFWYEGIKRIDVSKAIPISVGSYPALSMIFAILFLKEVPNIHQIIGFFVVMIGILTLIQKKTKITPV